MGKQVTLSEVASITLGQTFRRKAEAADGEVKLVQIKDLQEGRLSDIDHLPFAAIDKMKLKVTLAKGDILLPLRGERIVASLVDFNDLKNKVTTTNQVAIIRASSAKLNIEYLLWFFNSKIGQQSIKKIRFGSTVPNISLSVLKELVIPLPSLNEQHEIIEIYKNWFKQKQIMHELICNGECLIDKLCLKILGV
ncbi:restriction endonuclease subunit S [Microbulbifer variabilis]|uniref:restriction endonuclease subunit S n=1 Tax=Microbulbifer variabilis TaxID=266805 RepID=UPI001CFC6890|nr:restriction endonuclease subunit S [Microbulbifer variabilis]